VGWRWRKLVLPAAIDIVETVLDESYVNSRKCHLHITLGRIPDISEDLYDQLID
jgi:hypothetical protein